MFLPSRECRPSHRGEPIRVSAEQDELSGKVLGIARTVQQSGYAVGDELRSPATCRGDAGHAINQRLAHPKAARFWVDTALQSEVVVLVAIAKIGSKAKETHGIFGHRATNLPDQFCAVGVVLNRSPEHIELHILSLRACLEHGSNGDMVPLALFQSTGDHTPHRPHRQLVA